MKKKLFVFVQLIFICSPLYPQESLLLKISPVSFDEYNNIDPVFTSLLFSYNVLNINDVFLTRKILDSGGRETNSLMKWAVNNPPCDLIFKSALMLWENYTLKWIKKENEFLAYTAAILLNLLYSYVSYNNYQVIIRLNKEI